MRNGAHSPAASCPGKSASKLAHSISPQEKMPDVYPPKPPLMTQAHGGLLGAKSRVKPTFMTQALLLLILPNRRVVLVAFSA